jgi:hypothetical protein
MVLDRLPPGTTAAVPMRLAALQLAGAELALIRAWLAGEAHCESPTLARAICVTAESLRGSLFHRRNGS